MTLLSSMGPRISDTSGNVWEWTSSGSAAHRIIRGGPSYGGPTAQRIAVRITEADSAHGTDSASGFRCARSEPRAR
jgi:formylglycine-generating enzyme required for sulfatase activity